MLLDPCSRCRGSSLGSAHPLKPQRRLPLAPSLQLPPKSMAAFKSSCAKLQGTTANTRIVIPRSAVFLSCFTLRFSCLPRGKGVCEVKPPAANAGKAMKTRLGRLWEYSLFNYHNPNTIQRHGGGQKTRGDKEQKLLFSLETVGPRANTDTNAGNQVICRAPPSGIKHAPEFLPGEGNSGLGIVKK